MTLLSLFLLLVILAAWAWSYRRSDRFTWRWVDNAAGRTAWGDLRVSSAEGGVAAGRRRSETRGAEVSPTVRRDPLGISWTTYGAPTYPRRVDGPRFDFERWGFAWDWTRSRETKDWGDGPRTEEYAAAVVIVPYAALALPAAVLPVGRGFGAAWRRAARWRRLRRGRCGGCGYDLRGSGGRCPECGEAGRRTNDPARMTNDQAHMTNQ